MRVTYDPTVRAAYLYLSDEKVEDTERISDTVIIDFIRDNDYERHIIGIELLDVDMPVVEIYSAATASPADPDQ